MRLFAPILIALAVLASYWNSTHGQFQLDDWHTIQNNPAIRSLDAAHLKRLFTDINAFSVLPRNRDYRPALLLTYSLNHAASSALGDGNIESLDYNTRTWHWLNIALHTLAAISLYYIARELLRSSHIITSSHHPFITLLPLTAALLFAIHPINAGALNYISARSSLMAAAFTLPALAIYLRLLSGRFSYRWLIPLAILYTIALLTKIEAVAFLGVAVLAELTLNPVVRGRPILSIPIVPILRSAWPRLLTVTALSFGFVALWHHMSTLTASDRSIEGLTPAVYFLTQVRAWWYYVGQFCLPIHLVFDESAYPISGGEATAAGVARFSAARALMEPRVWIALMGWAAVALACLVSLRKAPIIPFLIGAFIIFLSPHSSFLPLAEMVNEHRPYLPVAGLFILATLGLWPIVQRLAREPRSIYLTIVAITALPLLALTLQRNLVYRNDLTLYGDTVAKSPNSARAQMNYGLALMRSRQYPEAEARFRKSLELAPNYHYAHTNLAIVLDTQGKAADAAAAHNAAVNSSPSESGPYYWRGRFRAKRGDLPGATADFRSAVNLNPSAFREAAGLAACLARAGAPDESLAARYGHADPAGFAAAQAEIANLFPPP